MDIMWSSKAKWPARPFFGRSQMPIHGMILDEVVGRFAPKAVVVRRPCQEGEKEPRVNDLLVLTFFRRHRYHELSWSLVAPLGPVCSCRFA